jgi:hypothetical protein
MDVQLQDYSGQSFLEQLNRQHWLLICLTRVYEFDDLGDSRCPLVINGAILLTTGVA